VKTASIAPSDTGAAQGAFRPQLTSLIDVMTILLVFLIKSFSVEGNLVTPSPDLELPVSTAKAPPEPRFSLTLTRDAVMGEGGVVAPIAEFEQSDSMLIPQLNSWIQKRKAHIQDTVVATEVLLQCDRELPFSIVKKVMYTCSKNGYSDFSVLVIREDE
jgi:biopolymer transport protein ExbD